MFLPGILFIDWYSLTWLVAHGSKVKGKQKDEEVQSDIMASLFSMKNLII